jgi:hypothetical protein
VSPDRSILSLDGLAFRGIEVARGYRPADMGQPLEVRGCRLRSFLLLSHCMLQGDLGSPRGLGGHPHLTGLAQHPPVARVLCFLAGRAVDPFRCDQRQY